MSTFGNSGNASIMNTYLRDQNLSTFLYFNKNYHSIIHQEKFSLNCTTHTHSHCFSENSSRAVRFDLNTLSPLTAPVYISPCQRGIPALLLLINTLIQIPPPGFTPSHKEKLGTTAAAAEAACTSLFCPGVNLTKVLTQPWTFYTTAEKFRREK